MSKAEKFIEDCTMNCSNELSEINNTIVGKMKVVSGYHPWLTPDQARKAVEIAKKDTTDAFARIIRGNLSMINEKVQAKFEQLYTEITGEKMYKEFKD